MPRHKIVRLLAPTLIAALALAAWAPRALHASVTSAHYKLDVEYSQDRLDRVACDGDSVPLTARVTRLSDGSPVAGASVHSDAGDALTNRRGVVRGAEIAEPGPGIHRALFVGATVDGESVSWLSFYSCPFPAGEFGITVTAFVDRDANGVRGRREPAYGGHDVSLSFVSGQSRASNLPPRMYGLDGAGAFSTTLPLGSNTNPGYERDGWSICLSDRELSRGWRIVSFNGAALAATVSCTSNFHLATGDNSVTIGVARTGPR